MTGAHIIEKARGIVGDNNADNPKETDATMRWFINQGVTQVINGRGEARMDTDGTVLTITAIDEDDSPSNDTVSIADRWELALIFFVCYMWAKSRNTAEEDARAAAYLSDFNTWLAAA